MKNWFCNGVSFLLTGLIYLLGGWDIAIQSLILIMIIDYITGVLSALYNKELSSKIGFKGILKKFACLLVVTLSVVIDSLLGQSGLIRSVVIYFFVANDGLSILENLAEMNVKLPEALKDALEQLQNRGD